MGLDLPVPDHSTLSRRARTLAVAPQAASGPVHLLVDSTGVTLSGPGEWRVEKHGTQRRRAWKKLHIGLDAATLWTWIARRRGTVKVAAGWVT